jgi:hypothetical protein
MGAGSEGESMFKKKVLELVDNFVLNKKKINLLINNKIIIYRSITRKIPHIYFDWNAIQDLKQEIFEKTNVDESAKKKWRKFNDIKKMYKMPLSEAHCKDLGKTIDQKWVDIDLEFLQENFIDGSWIFTVYNHLGKNLRTQSDYLFLSNELKKYYKLNPELKSFYECFKNRDTIPKQDLSIIHTPVKINLDKLKDSHILKDYLIENEGYLDGLVLEKFINDWVDNSRNKDYIKKIRLCLADLQLDSNAVYQNYENKEQWMDFFSGFIRFITIDLDLSDLSKHKEFINSFLKISKVNKTDIGTRIFIVFSLLNLTPTYGDKYKRKNHPSNTEADMLHVMAAWKSSYFVTKDAGLKNKIHAINQLLDLNINVITLDDFFNL